MPIFVILDMPFTENITSLPDNKAVLNDAISYFDMIKPNFIVIPCNTLHSYYDYITKSLNVPVVNMINQVKKVIIKKSYICPLLFSTTPVQENTLYESDKYQLMYPTRRDSMRVNKIIQRLCNGLNANNDNFLLSNIIKKYPKCDCYIYGCTELHNIWPGHENHISSLNVLAEYVINKIVHHRSIKRKMIPREK